MINDGPRVGPHSNVRSYLLELIDWSERELHYINEKLLKSGVTELQSKQENGYVDQEIFETIYQVRKYVEEYAFSELDNQFLLCHNDLFETNILVDPQGEIISIIDWDVASTFVPKNDINDIFGYANAIEVHENLIREWFE